MIPRTYVGQPARITFTSDFHELLTGDLRPGRPLHVSYDPRRLAESGESIAAGDPYRPIALHARFRAGGPEISVPLESPAGHIHTPLDETTTRAATLCAGIAVPEDAAFVSLWFTGTAADGGGRVDDDHGRTFLMRFPSLDIGTVTATVTGGRKGGTFAVTVPARSDVGRVTVRYRVVNAPGHPKGEFDLTRATGVDPDGEGRLPWSGGAPVPSGSSVVRFKIHYWVGEARFKEDNASAYFLAPPPPAEDIPPPPSALLEAARRFAAAAPSFPGAPAEDAVRQRAYEIWEEEGRPAGRALDHWYAAREEVAPKALGDGRYTAWRSGGVVTVRATGTLPQLGWRATLERNHAGAGIEYLLLFRAVTPPGEPKTEAFAIERSISHGDSATEIVVHDRRGRHVVAIGNDPPA